jgi:membrane protein YqaA with SNARE-associated domain
LSHIFLTAVQEQMDDSPKINIRQMLIVCLVVYCVMSVYIVIVYPDHTIDLLFYFTYMAVACTFLPLPTPPMVMAYGQKFDPVLIAFLGGIAFCISALIDYSLVTLVFRYEKIARIKKTKLYCKVERLFNKYAFVSLVVAAFTPIPLEPVKVVACASRYNKVRFILACFVGRTPRYYLLAKSQSILPIPRIYLYISIIVLMAIEAIRRLVKKSRQSHVMT